MKKLFLLLIGLSFTCFLASAKGVTTFADKFSEYSAYANADKMEGLVPLLMGETIRFSDFAPNKDITMFKYVVPDTIWIKQRPKKNPKEGKHYTLRHLYRSESYEDGYYYKTVKERTPAIELVGAQFLVNDVRQKGQSGYLSNPSFDVYLTNTATGEEIIWSIPNSYLDRGDYIVHLTGLSDKLNLAGQNIYSAESDGYSTTVYKNVKKYRCTGTDAIIDLRNTPQFQLRVTAIDEDNNERTFPLPISTSRYSYSSDKTIWFDESQLADVADSNKTYEIDYNVRLEVPKVEFPFHFGYIYGGLSGNSGSVGQTIKPSKYSSSANDLSSDAYLSEGDLFFIGDKITVRGEDFYKAAMDGRAFYIPTSKVKLSQEGKLKLDSLMSATPEVRDAFFELQKALSYYRYMNKMGETIDKIKALSSKGISIYSWGVYDESEYTDGTSIRFTFYNPTQKTIKYVNISFVGYNAVDDRVGRPISKRCIGPIEPDETASYNFEYAWFTDVVEYAKITSLSVQYKDGTTKTVANPHSVVWTSDMRDGLSKSSVDRLKYEVVGLDD